MEPVQRKIVNKQIPEVHVEISTNEFLVQCVDISGQSASKFSFSSC